jgi:hypothetical protein
VSQVGAAANVPSLAAAECSALRALVQRLVGLGVGLVACKRLVHPFVKQLLRRQQVAFVERLSALHAESVLDVCGGQFISTLAAEDVVEEVRGVHGVCGPKRAKA